MEWLGVLLLYLISGFLKKRQQDQKRKEIESDPSWDSDSQLENEKFENRYGQFLNDLFEQNPQTPELNKETRDSIKNETKTDEKNLDKEELVENTNKYDDSDLTKTEEKIESFEDKIYHSNLAKRRELHLGNKWFKSVNIKDELFYSKRLLRKSIIIKEILDKPVSLRN